MSARSPHRHDHPVREPVAARPRGGHDGRRGLVVGAVEARGVVGDQRAERGAAVGGQHEVGRRDGHRCRGHVGGIGEDDVGVGAAETERVDAGEARLAGFARQEHGVPGDGEVERVEIDVRVQFAAVQRGRQQVVFQRQHGLEDAAEAGGGLHVADVRLDGADRQRRGAAPREDLADGDRLDGIADRRSRPVRLDEGEIVRIEVALDVELVQQARLIRPSRVARCRWCARPN